MAVKKEIREILVAQSVKEIASLRIPKQKKIPNWQKNENSYYGKKEASTDARANVELGRMQEFVHTLLSKIDNPITFKYTKRKPSQYKRVQYLNALKEQDSQRGFWDMKDIVGKKQAIIYGRAVYTYYAESAKKYKSNLENVDVYDFLIDTNAGGIDIEQAQYLGRYGVVKTSAELKAGAGKIYLRDEARQLAENGTDESGSQREDMNKRNRMQANADKITVDNVGDRVKFWEWYTTYNGERYYLLLHESSATAIRVEKLTDLFPETDDYPLGMWPFWTWAAYPDLTEFWTPSYCDYVREVFMAQSVSINQMLDNAEQVNKPMKAVNVDAVEDLALLKYRRDGIIPVKNGFSAEKDIQFIKTPSIDTPLKVFKTLEGIQEKSSGVNAAAKGTAEEDKVGIYQGNQANTADRFGLLNKSYANGYRRFAKLYELGVRNHLTKKQAVDILGADGVEAVSVSRVDIFRNSDEFSVMVESANAEEQASAIDQKNKLTFLTSNAQFFTLPKLPAPLKKSLEMQGSVVGFSDEELRQLLDTSEFGDASLMSEAERDIEMILEGKEVRQNRKANTAYKQRFVDYMDDHNEDISDEQFVRLSQYLMSLDQVIMRNTVRDLQSKMVEMGGQPQIGAQPDMAQPSELSTLSTNIEQNVPVQGQGA